MQTPVIDVDSPAATAAGYAAAVSITLVLSAGFWVFFEISAGPLARHMAVHIVIMNILAPLAAVALLKRIAPLSARSLWALTGFQLAVLVAWHAMSPHLGEHFNHLILMAVLAIASSGFWLSIFHNRSRWHPLAALLLTGKIVCLGGALLIFAPSSLHHGIDLADQQLAGLLMVTACPLSYLASALVLLVREIETSGTTNAQA